jgi:hypothetical protein
MRDKENFHTENLQVLPANFSTDGVMAQIATVTVGHRGLTISTVHKLLAGTY